jgi:hypothetical protein
MSSGRSDRRERTRLPTSFSPFCISCKLIGPTTSQGEGGMSRSGHLLAHLSSSDHKSDPTNCSRPGKTERLLRSSRASLLQRHARINCVVSPLSALKHHETTTPCTEQPSNNNTRTSRSSAVRDGIVMLELARSRWLQRSQLPLAFGLMLAWLDRGTVGCIGTCSTL